MTVEDFILLCKLKGWHEIAEIAGTTYTELRNTVSQELLDHLKRRKQA